MPKMVKSTNIAGLALGLLIFLQILIVLSISQVHYRETVHRTTVERIFNENLFGSSLADGLATVGLCLLFICIFFKTPLTRIISILAFAGACIAFALRNDILILASFATIPIMLGFYMARARLLSTRAIRNNENQRPANKIRLRTIILDLPPLRTVLVSFLIVTTIVEAGALAMWITFPASNVDINGDITWKLAAVEAALFNTIAALSPILLVMVAFSLVYRRFLLQLFRLPNTSEGKADLSRGKPNLRKVENNPRAMNTGKRERLVLPQADYSALHEPPTKLRSVGTSKLILCAALAAGVFIAIYPDLPRVNSSGSGTSTDEQYYLRWIDLVKAQTGGDASLVILNTFEVNQGDRPLTLLVILSLSYLTRMPELTIIRFLPIILVPSLILANYYFLLKNCFTNQLRWKANAFAAVGSVFAAFSIQVAALMYAGLLANWFALILAFAAFAIVLKLWRAKKTGQILTYSLAMLAIAIVIMLFHVYTWIHVAAILILYGILSLVFAYRQTYGSRLKIVILIGLIASVASIELAKTASSETTFSLSPDSALLTNIRNESSATQFSVLVDTLGVYLGSTLSNPLLLGLGIVWALKANLKLDRDRIFMAMALLLILPIALGGPEFQARIFIDTPFHMMAVLGLSGLNLRDRKYQLLFIAIILSLGCYALRSMANL